MSLTRLVLAIVVSILLASHQGALAQEEQPQSDAAGASEEPPAQEQPRQITWAELAQHDGHSSGDSIWVGLAGRVWDVSGSGHMYGPGGSYSGQSC